MGGVGAGVSSGLSATNMDSEVVINPITLASFVPPPEGGAAESRLLSITNRHGTWSGDGACLWCATGWCDEFLIGA
jgi:hypothetical protein